MVSTPASPPRAPTTPAKAPNGYTQPVWDLRCALWAASTRLPRGSGLQRYIEGAERFVKLGGRGRPGPGPGSAESVQWWQDVLAITRTVYQVGDHGTRLLLAPWVAGDRAAGGGFKPFGGA